MSKKTVTSIIRIVISAAIITYIFTAVIKPAEMWSQVKQADMGLAWKVFLLAFLPMFLCSIRWLILIRALDLHVSLWEIFRLNYIGVFFNNFMIGATGGDIIKAVVVAKITEKKVPAIVSIFVDRVMGLVALAVIGAFAVLYYYDSPELFYPRMIIFGILAGGLMFVFVYFSRTVRESGIMKFVLSKLPLQGVFREIDETFVLYKQRKIYVLMSLVVSIIVHCGWILVIIGFGKCFGENRMTVLHYFAYVPIALMANALPISLGGIGVGEYAYITLFAMAGVPESISGAMGIAARISAILWTLPGGIFFALGTEKIRIREKDALEMNRS